MPPASRAIAGTRAGLKGMEAATMRCMTTRDRIFRSLVGLVVVAIGIYFQSWWGAAGLMPLLAGAIGRCPSFGATRKFYLDREGLAVRAAAEDAAGYRTK